MVLEVVVETVEDALAADAGGADQVEVKCDYLEFGLTPTFGMLEEITRQVSCDVLCMIRPHARSLNYSHYDLAVMKNDLLRAKQLPVSGFLLGCLTEQGDLDLPALEELKEAAYPLGVHFHLGWEQTRAPMQALLSLIELGFSSVRTSGGAGISGDALTQTSKIVEYQQIADGKLDLYLAGGVRIENLDNLLMKTGIDHVHTGSGVREPESRTGSVVVDKVQKMKRILMG